jgi:hypothetical protein
MTIPLFVQVVATLVSFLMLWFLYSFAYRDYRRDVYRQKLFEARNGLFDLASSGQISFDHPAYQTLRTTINGFIRFGHRMRFGELVVFLVLEETAKDKSPDVFNERWARQTTTLPPEVRDRLNQILVRVHRLALEQLVLTSPLLLALLLPPVMVVAMKNLSQAMWLKPYTWCRSLIQNRWVSALDSAALEEGSFAVS